MSAVQAKHVCKTIFLANTLKHGRDEARKLGFDPRLVVSPNSTAAARGVNACYLFDSGSLDPLARERMLPDVMPAILTSRHHV